MLPPLTHSSEHKCVAMAKPPNAKHPNAKHPNKWHTTSRHERGYDHRWDKLRLVVLTRDNHLCQVCLSRNRVTAANQVDHIVPRSKGGGDELENLQALCKPCHDAKTVSENHKSQRLTRDDGW